jgi:hypothetical protein
MSRASHNVVLAVLLAFTALAASVTTGASAAPMQGVIALHLMDRPPNWSVAYKARVEHAIEHNVGSKLAPVWHAAKVTFRPYGIPVRFIGPWGTKRFCHGDDAAACHTDPTDGKLQIFVSTGKRTLEATRLSHEVDELDVDPYFNTTPTTYKGYTEEICDPVAGMTQNVYGVPLSLFVYPRFYREVVAAQSTSGGG